MYQGLGHGVGLLSGSSLLQVRPGLQLMKGADAADQSVSSIWLASCLEQLSPVHPEQRADQSGVHPGEGHEGGGGGLDPQAQPDQPSPSGHGV